jgi:hypothetical protein
MIEVNYPFPQFNLSNNFCKFFQFDRENQADNHQAEFVNDFKAFFNTKFLTNSI